MASPPSRSASASLSTPLKLPPTGPRALRGANDVPQPGPSGLSYRDKISFAIPLQPSGLQSRKVGFDSSSSLGNFGSKVRSITVPKIPVDARSSNGFSSSSPAESSRQAQTAQSQRHGLSNGRESQTSPSFPSSSSSTPYDHQTSSKEGTSRHSTTRHHDSNHRRSPSPRSDRDKSPLNGAERPSRKVKDAEEDDYRARFLPTDSAVRSPISIALPGFPNGTPRPRPPHLDVSPFEIGVASKSHHPPIPKRSQPPSTPRHRPPIPLSPDEHYSVPPPPADRPPTPPPPTDRSPTPPPPPDLAPLPPPSPPIDPPSLPTPPMISRPRSPSPPPATTAQSRPLPVPRTPLVTTPFSLPTSGPSAPPSFHFRELPLLPLLRKSPSADEESVAASEGSLDPPGPELPLDSPPPAAQASSRPRSTSPPPYIPPPYVPPASTRRRSGIGNFLVLHDPAAQGSKGGKEVIKRYDGKMGEDEVKVEDPRLQISEEVRQRGRGSAKQRTGFHELEYEWDEYSTGPKPPPPPTAVLITGLNPLTTVDQISKFLRPHGRIREIEPKMDLRSGMQLGICWVKFDGPLPGRPGTGQDVANQIIKVCDGQRIGLAGDERIKIVLDGRGLRTEEAVKEERARRHPPKKVELPKPIAAPAIKTPSSGAATPRPDSVSKGPLSVAPKPVTSFLPRPNRPQIVFNTAERSNSSLSRSLPVRSFNVHSSLPSRPMTGIQQLSSSFIDAPFAHRAHDNHRKHYDDFRESHFSRHSRSRSRSYSLCSTCTPDSESDDDRPVYRRRSRSPYGGARGRVRGPGPNRKEDEDAVERMKKALAVNGHAYAFIDANSLPPKSVSEEHLKDHFRAFKPSQVRCNYQGWCILFNDDSSAQRAKFLDSTSVQGHRLVINVKTPSTAQKSFEGEALPVSANEAKVEKGWRFLTFTKKNRPTIPPPKASSKTEARPRRRSFSSTSSEDESSRLRSRKTSVSSASELSEEEAKITVPKRKRLKETPTSVDDASITIPHDEPMHLAEGEPEIDVVPSKKRAAKPKTKKGAKKARITSDDEEIEVPIPLTLQPEVVEIKLEAPKKGAKAVKEPKPKKVAPDPVDKLVASGEVADEEDAYWLGQALEAAHEGFEPDFFDDEEELLDEKHPLHHVAGAWRAEGLKKVPQIQKSSYLPQRNRAAVSAEDAGALTSGRTARVTGRRLALDMETHRKTAASVTAESDLFAFNQLRIRKKQLRFARSAIEGYGLYAMETIQTGEMVCEYVGEICRSAVAEIREQRYLKQGIGSSYLFRIDADAVCDATFRGSVSRLINHSCDPSASAKIISINGHSKIVIYAKRTLHPGEEILYDYKFPLESDPALRVPCLCGAATCRGWLN